MISRIANYLLSLRQTTFRAILLVLILGFVNGVVNAQSPGVKAYSVELGLGEQVTLAKKIYQDSVGLIWISRWSLDYNLDNDTTNSLLRYDGNRIENVVAESIKNGFNSQRLIGVTDDGNYLLADRSLMIWNPYENKGLHHYDIDSSLIKNGKPFRINSAYKDNSGVLWASLSIKKSEHGWFYYLLRSDDDSILRPYKLVESGSFDQSNHLLLLGDFLFYIDKTSLLRMSTRTLKTDTLNITNSVEQMPQGLSFGEGELFIKLGSQQYERLAKPKGLDRIAVVKPLSLDINYIDLPVVDRIDRTKFVRYLQGDLWLIGNEFSIFKYNIETEKLSSLRETLLALLPEFNTYTNPISDVFLDRSETYWISSGAGLARFTLPPDYLDLYLSGKGVHKECTGDFCSIRGITEDSEGRIYFSYENGIKYLDQNEKEPIELDIPFPEIEKQGAYSLTSYDNLLIWNDKVIDLNTRSVETLLPDKVSTRVVHHLDKQNGILWMLVYGRLNTLYRYDLSSKILKRIQLAVKTEVGFFYEIHYIDYDTVLQKVLISSASFIGFVDPEDGSVFKDFTIRKNGERRGGTAVFLEDGKALWNIRDLKSGLRRIDLRSGKQTYFTFRDQQDIRASYSHTYFIEATKAKMFIGTGKGVVVFDRTTKELRYLDEIPIMSRFEFNRSSSFISSKGDLYMGTTQGLFQIPVTLIEDITEKKVGQRLRMRSINYRDRENKSVQIWNGSYESEITIPPYYRNLRFQYYVPDYSEPNLLNYSHWLEGYEDTFSAPILSSELEYSYLPPGNYILHLKGGINAPSRENSEILIPIHVKQVWYKTIWAWMAYILLIVVIILLIYRFQLDRAKQVNEARKQKELDTFKTKFFTNITHELRTPLTVILGLTSELDEEIPQRSVIRRNGQKLLGLINEILDLSKLDAGKLTLNLRQKRIDKFLHRTVAQFHSMAKMKNVDLKGEFSTGVLVMDFDESKLQSVLSNLITNAIKYTPEGGYVEVRAYKENSKLILDVEDNGVGIPDNDAENIFNRYYRSEHTKDTLGTGVGLSICKELIDLMKGEIRCLTEREQGSLFQIVLPITQESTLDEEEILPIHSEVDFKNNHKGNLDTVLVVEDDDDIRSFIVRSLSANCNTLEASNGETGLKMATEFLPDVIVSDVMMPEMDGFELCHQIKSNVLTSHIPIILLTARVDKESMMDGLKTGADAYLKKPFEQEELTIRIYNLLELRKKMQEHLLSQLGSSDKQKTETNPFIDKINNLLEQNIDNENLQVNDISDELGMSRMQLHRKVKALTNMSVTEYVNQFKMRRALVLLAQPDINISEIAYQLGFSDPAYFTRVFSKFYKYSPTKYRDNIKR